MTTQTMTTEKTITLYQYDGLPSEKAKEKAIQWFLGACYGDEWWDCTLEDAKNIGLKITSFGLDRDRHAKGEFITSAVECAESIIGEHGETCETYKTSKDYLAEFKALGDRPSDSDDEADDSEWEERREETDNEFLRSLLEDYSILLQNESEYQSSDEYLEEGIRANEYTFLEDGTRFD